LRMFRTDHVFAAPGNPPGGLLARTYALAETCAEARVIGRKQLEACHASQLTGLEYVLGATVPTPGVRTVKAPRLTPHVC